MAEKIVLPICILIVLNVVTQPKIHSGLKVSRVFELIQYCHKSYGIPYLNPLKEKVDERAYTRQVTMSQDYPQFNLM